MDEVAYDPDDNEVGDSCEEDDGYPERDGRWSQHNDPPVKGLMQG